MEECLLNAYELFRNVVRFIIMSSGFSILSLTLSTGKMAPLCLESCFIEEDVQNWKNNCTAVATLRTVSDDVER